ncbi:MAG: RNA methyltransferase, partial [Eggerthellaceae bacterium]|nr:RNA methyltransferase [Eggerthellaceae bacterium]
MDIEEVTSLNDHRIDAYVSLTDLELRSRIEPERAMLIAESASVIERAYDAGLQPLSVLTEEKWLKPMSFLLESMSQRWPDLKIYVAARDVLKNIVGYELTRGALACFKRPQPPSFEEVIRDAETIAVIENITNHANVGAIFRSAAALGVDGIIIGPASYDPFYRRAARVSMGAVFQIPWMRYGSDHHAGSSEALLALKENGFVTAAMSLGDQSITLDEFVATCRKRTEEGQNCSMSPSHGFDKCRVALAFGTEGEGLLKSTISACDYEVRIPMDHGID